MSDTMMRLHLNGREIILLGTAHISQESIDEVKASIETEKPDRVAIELDETRYKSMMEEKAWQNLDIVSVLKNKKGFLLLANLVLASFQRRMGASIGIKPGDEMKAAAIKANELHIPVSMVDRPIEITLRRAWTKNSLWQKSKLLAFLISSIFDKAEVSQEQIEKLKHSAEMDSMMSEMASYLPAVKEVLIDERDRYLSGHIWSSEGNKILAVIGAGHLQGVKRHLEQMDAGNESSDTSDIASVPGKKVPSIVAGSIIAAIIIALIVCGFVFGGRKIGTDMIGRWILWNGALAAAGTLLAGGHPITVLSAFIGAPFTSLIPVVGVGMITGIVQASVNKPKVSDMELLQQDAGSLKGFYRNRILRALLVFLLSSIGSSAGTFIAGSSFIGINSRLFFG